MNGENSGIGLNVQRLVAQELKVEPELRFKKLNMEVKNVKDLRLSSVLARRTFAQVITKCFILSTNIYIS